MVVRKVCALVGGLALLALSRVLYAEPAAPVRPPRIEFTLENGLRTILVPDEAASTISVVVSYAAGYAHDPPSYRGLAHLVEHLTFRGSTHLRPLEGVTILEDLGASYQGLTAADTTTYQTVAPAFALETVLWIESERMGFTLGGVDEKALALEQRVVSNELRQRTSYFDKHWTNALYGAQHPYSFAENPTDDVNAVNLGGVRWFFQRTYRPDNATLVIVGRFEPNSARAFVEKYFRPIVNPKLPRATVSAPAPRLCGIHQVELVHPYVLGKSQAFTWVVPRSSAPEERSALELVRRLLQERLTGLLVKERFLAGSIQSWVAHNPTHDLLSVTVKLLGEDPWHAVQEATLAEARRLAQRPVSVRELSYVRKSALLEKDLSLHDPLQYALALSRGEDAEGERAALGSLGPAAIQRAAQPLAGAAFVISSKPTAKHTREPLVSREVNPCD